MHGRLMWILVLGALLATLAVGSASADDAPPGGDAPASDDAPTASPAVRNGSAADPADYPWMMSIARLDGTTWSHHCGGTLIAPNTVMTAAHCTRPGAGRLSVRRGSQYQATSQVAGIEVREIIRPGGVGALVQSDIALLVLRSNVTGVTPIALAIRPPAQTSDARYRSMGWGSTCRGLRSVPSDPGCAPGGLRQIDLRVVADSRCTPLMDPGMLCTLAGSRAGMRRADSGGPLIARGRNGDWYQVGIVSGSDDGYGDSAAFTEVSSWRAWVDRNTAFGCQRRLPTHYARAGRVTRGTGGADVIFGSNGADQIRGLAGADLICARSGDDDVWGGPGNDRVFGGSGNDRLRGEGGNDFIRGQVGADAIWGAQGRDTLNGDRGRDACFGGAGDDVFRGCDAPQLPRDLQVAPLDARDCFVNIFDTELCRVTITARQTQPPLLTLPRVGNGETGYQAVVSYVCNRRSALTRRANDGTLFPEDEYSCRLAGGGWTNRWLHMGPPDDDPDRLISSHTVETGRSYCAYVGVVDLDNPSTVGDPEGHRWRAPVRVGCFVVTATGITPVTGDSA